MRHMATVVLGALLAMALSACGNDAANDAPAVAEPVTAEQVQTIAENILAAYNTGDYGSFSRPGRLGPRRARAGRAAWPPSATAVEPWPMTINVAFAGGVRFGGTLR